MECHYCETETKEIRSTHKLNNREKIIIISNIPTLQCSTCEENYYTAYVSDNIDKIVEIIQSYKIKDKTILVDYDEIIRTIEEISTAV